MIVYGRHFNGDVTIIELGRTGWAGNALQALGVQPGWVEADAKRSAIKRATNRMQGGPARSASTIRLANRR